MKKTVGLSVLMMLISFMLLTAGSVQAGGRQTKSEDAAVSAARTWLGMVDAGKYAEAWGNAAGYFKNAVSEENFTASLDGVRGPLGRAVKRSLLSATFTKTLPGAPDGEYVVIQFKTEFERKREAVETITPMKERDGKWRVSGYYIK